MMGKDTLLTIGFRVPDGYLNALRDEIYQDAVAHGLWEDTDREAESWSSIMPPEKIERQRWATAANLVKCEARELDDVGMEGFYGKEPLETYRVAYEEELADVVIQAFSTAGYLGIDIDAAIRRKMEINKSRPWKHKGEKK